jgi:hypothetical protein
MALLLSPYAHELHHTGERCADDCPACKWAEEFEAQVELVKKPPRSFVPVGVKKGLEERVGS